MADHLPRLYADSAELDAVTPLLQGSLVHGVSTNPTLLERAGLTTRDIPQLTASLLESGAREVFLQTWGDSEQDLMRRAHELLALSDRVVVKVAATAAGFAVGSRLAREGIPVLLTAVYTPGQALAAASSGIRYIAPYLGRMRDAGLGDIDTIARMQRVCGRSDTEVFAASVRTPDDIVDLVEAGITAITAHPTVLRDLLYHDVTEQSAADFNAARSIVTDG
ncbi:transaldolase family protein [uncultured Agrococcus sp.]|uniref:transaldolase family protein n=1 Tax=uncultured Agrococcus sp. TaxID=382258 RepID=UPI0025F4D8B6|nr:transaldolase family protein [uncultured Agrococcus sp.]